MPIPFATFAPFATAAASFEFDIHAQRFLTFPQEPFGIPTVLPKPFVVALPLNRPPIALLATAPIHILKAPPNTLAIPRPMAVAIGCANTVEITSLALPLRKSSNFLSAGMAVLSMNSLPSFSIQFLKRTRRGPIYRPTVSYSFSIHPLMRSVTVISFSADSRIISESDFCEFAYVLSSHSLPFPDINWLNVYFSPFSPVMYIPLPS